MGAGCDLDIEPAPAASAAQALRAAPLTVRFHLDGEYKDKTCCILGLRGSLVREEPGVTRAITQALLDAAMYTAQNPDVAAASFQPYARAASLQDLQAMVDTTPTITIPSSPSMPPARDQTQFRQRTRHRASSRSVAA
jgi:ABC-type nitrate/sulfonate/bicarbonate transport system substrate-binding protein